MKQYLVKFTCVVDAEDDASDDEIRAGALDLIDMLYGNFEYVEV